MKKIVTIIGARPQFIKAGSVSRELEKENNAKEVLVHTGQHYDANMSDIFFKQMHLPKPDYNLGIGSMSHGEMTGKMIEKIENILFLEKPDYVLVYGDTNSTLAGAIAASKLNIALAHVEAGLRSNNMKMPEEINRILTDRISNLLFCPTQKAIENLFREGFEHFDCTMIKTGDVMQDSALFYREYAKAPASFTEERFVLCTVHRAENTDDRKRLSHIFEALEKIASEHSIVLPLHPRTRKRLQDYGISPRNIHMMEPIGYLEMIWLIDRCNYVITDSGGLQKEAFFFKKPCITIRDETEWVELIENGFNVLAGSDKDTILEKSSTIDQMNHDYSIDLFGVGQASKMIAKELIK